MLGDQDSRESGVYQVRCLVNDKIYVGSSINIRARWAQHRYHLRLGTHYSQHFLYAWRKYGPAGFAWEIIEIVPMDGMSKAEFRPVLLAAEQRTLDRLRPFDRGVGYNASPCAGSPLGTKLSAEARAKMSARRRGCKHSPEWNANSAKGRTGLRRGAEARAKMSAAAKKRCDAPGYVDRFLRTMDGKNQSTEYRRKMAAVVTGRKHTAETRAKMRAVNGSPESRARNSAARIGKKRAPEIGAKISAAKKGKPLASEAREKITSYSRNRTAEHRANLSAAVSASNRARGRRRKPSDGQGSFNF